jgi:hypothetical protein
MAGIDPKGDDEIRELRRELRFAREKVSELRRRLACEQRVTTMLEQLPTRPRAFRDDPRDGRERYWH